MAGAVDRHLEEMERLDEADRRNGSYDIVRVNWLERPGEVP